ncbi:MAG: MBL fold metallo-hydrolase [Thermoplasmata archaeon]|jgi:hydroxyacylglutathione hydrolase
MSGPGFDFGRPDRPKGDLGVRWIHGSPSPRQRTDPPIQVHAYEPATYILRESKDVSYEAPFLYLFLGNERAILFDTGTTSDPQRFPIRRTIDTLVEAWLKAHPRAGYELVVAHTHSHTDHTGGDAQFADRPNTRIVGRSPEEVHRFFGLTGPHCDPQPFDLGGRTIEVFPIPGHHPASIAVYDRWTTVLLTGDTICPGRIYIFDMPAYRTSIERIARFVEERPVRWILGGHVEMTQTARLDYPLRAKYQPLERPLEIPPGRLPSLLSAVRSAAGRPGVYPTDDSILFNGVGVGTILAMLWRGWRWNLRYRRGAIH